MELDSSNTRNNVFSWIIFLIYLLLNIFIFVITYIKYHRGEIFLNYYSLEKYLFFVKFKGSSGTIHFIFEINVGKSWIRHRTTEF